MDDYLKTTCWECGKSVKDEIYVSRPHPVVGRDQICMECYKYNEANPSYQPSKTELKEMLNYEAESILIAGLEVQGEIFTLRSHKLFILLIHLSSYIKVDKKEPNL